MITYVWAQDPFLADEHVARVEADAGEGTEVLHLTAESGEVPGLSEALTAPSLFAESRIVVVREAERLSTKGAEATAELLRGSSVATQVVVVAVSERSPSALSKQLQGLAEAHRLERPRRGELVNWAARRLQAAGVKPAKDAAPALVECVGSGSLRDLASAIEQLALRRKGGPVTRGDVLSQFGRTAEQPVWALFDALLARDRPRAFAVLHMLLAQGEDPMAILFALVSQVRYLMRTRSLVEQGGATSDAQIASAIGVSPGRAGVLRRQSGRAPWDWLVACHALLGEADVDLKGGEIYGRSQGTALPQRIVLERVVAGVVDAAESVRP